MTRSAMWRRNARTAAGDLVEECEALLTGRYPEYLARHGHRIPPSAWTNPLAHAPAEQLRAMISTRGEGRAPACGWHQAFCYVAGEVLDLAERRGPLADLQGSALVPLELDLMSRRQAGFWRPATWVEHVLAGLPDSRPV
jgi:hypothetical protein